MRTKILTAAVLVFAWMVATGPAHAGPTRGLSIWPEQRVSASDGGANDSFGQSVALDGDIALIGAPNATVENRASQGAAYVFTLTNGVWTETAKLIADDGASFDTFGYSVALSGSTAVVGAWHATVDGSPLRGAAYVFTRSGDSWSQTAKLVADDGVEYDDFGYAVAVSGTTAFICTPYAGNSQGAVYVFSAAGGSWLQMQKLATHDGAIGDNLGWSVSLDGGIAVVGAPFASVDTRYQQGAAYVFTEFGGTWSEAAKLVAGDGIASEYFGFAVALDGTTAVIGAPYAHVGGGDPGAAYVFDEAAGDWSETQKLAANEGTAGDQFGYKVAIDGTTALAGAPFAPIDGHSEQGAAYVFGGAGDTWSESDQLTASDGVTYQSFGFSVAASPAAALVGVPNTNVDGHAYQGAAYFYTPPTDDTIFASGFDS